MLSTAEPGRRPLVIAVDFDGTIVTHEFPKIGAPLPDAFRVLRALAEAGHVLVLWTCREDDRGRESLTDAVRFCQAHGVHFDGVNERPAGLGGFGPGRKLWADLYIDDRNLGGFPGWRAVATALGVPV